MSEQELERQAKHRLAVMRHAQEISGNVAQTCRYYGISRQTYYSWFRRYEELGLDGLRDRYKRPQVSPLATPPEVVAKTSDVKDASKRGAIDRARALPISQRSWMDLAASPAVGPPAR